jgi:hypothetical protein
MKMISNNFKTMKDLLEKFGQEFGRVSVGGMDVDVICLDVRKNFGRDEVKIIPRYGGDREVWVEASRVDLKANFANT